VALSVEIPTCKLLSTLSSGLGSLHFHYPRVHQVDTLFSLVNVFDVGHEGSEYEIRKVVEFRGNLLFGKRVINKILEKSPDFCH